MVFWLDSIIPLMGTLHLEPASPHPLHVAMMRHDYNAALSSDLPCRRGTVQPRPASEPCLPILFRLTLACHKETFCGCTVRSQRASSAIRRHMFVTAVARCWRTLATWSTMSSWHILVCSGTSACVANALHGDRTWLPINRSVWRPRVKALGSPPENGLF